MFQAEIAIAGDARGKRQRFYESLKRDPSELVSMVKRESGLVENRPVIHAVVAQ
jgi:hypothetical protein